MVLGSVEQRRLDQGFGMDAVDVVAAGMDWKQSDVEDGIAGDVVVDEDAAAVAAVAVVDGAEVAVDLLEKRGGVVVAILPFAICG